MLNNFSLTKSEFDLFTEIVWDLKAYEYHQSLREKTLVKVANLLQADFGASYVMDKITQTSRDGVAHNINTKSIKEYDLYWQFNDPITPQLYQRGRATTVDEIIIRSEFEKTEFYNEFLKANNMYHGINIYFKRDNNNVGDMRIWRNQKSPAFAQKERIILDTLAQFFNLALPDMQIVHNLTNKQLEVATFIGKGFTDKEIADLLNISHSTVRTHIKHLFNKLDCTNRTELVSQLKQVHIHL